MPLPSFRRPRSAIGVPATLLLTLFAAACDHSPGGPGSNPIQFSRTVSLPDAQSLLQTGPTRVEVRVIPGTLLARRVELEESQEMTRPERVRSRVTAVTAGTDTATFTLEVGGLKIAANGSSQIRHDDDDASSGTPTLADFVALVQADIAAGHNPTLTASRQPPTAPQAPGDGAFLAADLKIDEGNNHSVLQLNIAAANLVTNPTPPPDGFLKVLGLSLELRLSDGTTTLKQENPEVEGVREFEGLVQSVDVTAQTVTLKDGTIIRIVAGTEFEAREGDGDDHLTGLPAVKDALTAGKTVQAEGRGLVDSANPLTLDAIRIEFEVRGEEPPPPVMMVEFEGTVASVDVAGSKFTLDDGTVVAVTSETRIDAEGDIHTLQAAADALTAHHAVRAEGRATVTSAGPPRALTALDVKFETP
ncbi:MAG: hypothetical protein DMD60_06270 [Gemmatimonadetes bacterium]|nr:MAG: hypothetical protein DMD60_06270 [Gemmatimonadota bacterium]